jgi:hypothetical protein
MRPVRPGHQAQPRQALKRLRDKPSKSSTAAPVGCCPHGIATRRSSPDHRPPDQGLHLRVRAWTLALADVLLLGSGMFVWATLQAGRQLDLDVQQLDALLGLR